MAALVSAEVCALLTTECFLVLYLLFMVSYSVIRQSWFSHMIDICKYALLNCPTGPEISINISWKPLVDSVLSVANEENRLVVILSLTNIRI